MALSVKAFNTITLLRNATWLNNESEIKYACKEIAEYLAEDGCGCRHFNFTDTMDGAVCDDCGEENL
jgi:hypothetical protein